MKGWWVIVVLLLTACNKKDEEPSGCEHLRRNLSLNIYFLKDSLYCGDYNGIPFNDIDVNFDNVSPDTALTRAFLKFDQCKLRIHYTNIFGWKKQPQDSVVILLIKEETILDSLFLTFREDSDSRCGGYTWATLKYKNKLFVLDKHASQIENESAIIIPSSYFECIKIKI